MKIQGKKLDWPCLVTCPLVGSDGNTAAYPWSAIHSLNGGGIFQRKGRGAISRVIAEQGVSLLGWYNQQTSSTVSSFIFVSENLAAKLVTRMPSSGLYKLRIKLLVLF